MRKNGSHSSNTCNMYMSGLRHTHDPVLSSLKMEGIRLFFFSALIGSNTYLLTLFLSTLSRLFPFDLRDQRVFSSKSNSVVIFFICLLRMTLIPGRDFKQYPVV
jgi:hypothetical protein